MQNVKEQIAPTHPIFQLTQTRILWSDYVMKKSTHKVMQQRLLVIAASGMFLFKKTAFPKGLAISRIIPYSALILVTADSQKMGFYMPKISMSLYHQNHVQIAAMVLAIRSILFGDKPRTLKKMFDDEISIEIEASKYNFKFDSILAERFLSLCVEIPSKDLIPEQMNDTYEGLKKFTKTATITPEMLTSNLFGPVAKAIAFDTNIDTLILKGLNFTLFVPYFIPIIQYNSSIHNIVMQSISFSGNLTPYFNIWKERTLFSANTYTFLDCQLSTKNFFMYFYSFKDYPADIQSLNFVHCNLNKASLFEIFKYLMTMNCFRVISELYFSEITSSDQLEAPLKQVFGSQFFQQHKNIRDFSLIDGSYNVNALLPVIVKRAESIAKLNFTKNTFLNPIEQITEFYQIEEINLSQCTFNSKSLLSFFSCLSGATNSPSRIILNQLSIISSEWTEFYNGLSECFIIPNLVMISWCDNMMNSQQFEKFVRFLIRQPKFSELGISNAISTDDSNNSLQYLSELIKSKPIRKLEIRGGEKSLGSELISILNDLLAEKTIKMLDVSGQGIGNEGLEIIGVLAGLCLEELRFDNNLPSDHDILIKILNKIINSKMSYCDWPKNDISACLQKIAANSRQAVQNDFMNLRNQFQGKFIINDELTNSIGIKKRKRTNSIFQRRIKSESIYLYPPKIDTNILMYRNSLVSDAITECFNKDYLKTDPLVEILEKLDNETSVKAYLQQQTQNA
ncbi:hypothetical protein TRFO_29163 [Tritrichomonas foetus]|uniref:Leucine Rich Repeat family protein n=1 Tax=Tritrichomonas foetus TaxID=1144522 RepID=A0A1J4K1Y8_9EUKA|nr:hypothetical protein TRFO_29163 [Tritrichomonas foetus]|eukprot:OHT03493.1 hypothetical protein TRFO_29163 [Tritrichomonas foetus]